MLIIRNVLKYDVEVGLDVVARDIIFLIVKISSTNHCTVKYVYLS